MGYGKELIIFFVFVAVISIILVFFYFSDNFFGDEETIPTCGDGTFYDKCSLDEPYYCVNGKLVEKSSVCGCPEGLVKSNDGCISELNQNPRTATLNYVLRGEEKSFNLVAYDDAERYFSELSRSITYEDGEIPFREDFKLKKINEEEQRHLLLPIVKQIQNLANDKDDQVRIAISVVQNIPWGISDKKVQFGNNQLDYSRYPYEVFYGSEGSCGEKSELLAFLLKELGFEVVIFYNQQENHESVGIKCASQETWHSSGYCFVETSGPSIITDNTLVYDNGVILSSQPDILLISSGLFLKEDLYEYEDSKELEGIRKRMATGKLNFYDEWKYNNLREKYGLDGVYNL